MEEREVKDRGKGEFLEKSLSFSPITAIVLYGDCTGAKKISCKYYHHVIDFTEARTKAEHSNQCDFKLNAFPKTLQSLWEVQSSKN